MGSKGWFGLIGAKIACCGILLLVLTGVLSVGVFIAVLSGNTPPLAGATIFLALFLARRRMPMRITGWAKSASVRE